MEKQEIGELLCLLHAARNSGVLPQIMASMEVPQVASRSMTDAGKRPKGDSKADPETSSSEWNDMDFPKDDPSKDAVARYENDESGKVVAKELAPPAPPTDHIHHVDKSVRVPIGTPSFYEWSRTRITMDKYEKNHWCFAELVSFAETDKKAMRYCRWLVGSYGSPPSVDPQNQAEDFGAFARACGIKPAEKGYQQKTK